MKASASAWRWFPGWMGLAMAAVFAVNGYMVFDALSTFPGVAGEDGFDLSNGYGRVMEATERQAAVGWQLAVEVPGDRHPLLHLHARGGAPLADAAIDAEAERPVGPPHTMRLAFDAAGAGAYRAGAALPAGQWDILLTIRGQGHVFTATRRVVAR